MIGITRIAAVLAISTSHVALAQAQVPVSQTSAPQDVGAGQPGAQDAEPAATAASEIVVTGSRLVRDGSQAPTPVTVVSSESLAQTAPSNIPDALNKLPIFSGSQSQSSSATSSSAAASPAMGNYLNLRNLGINRVLVLLNGSRVPPTSNTNAVDVNVLPQLLISRVDVVTGGASAAYGSDAVSGVVNFILNERFKGLKGVLQSGITDKGDSASHRYGAAAGVALGDSVHVLASYEHYENRGIRNLLQRDWSAFTPITVGGGTAANPLLYLADARARDLAYGGLVTSVPAGTLAPLSACGATVVACDQFAPDGSLIPYTAGRIIAGADQMGGGSGTVWGRSDTTPLTGRLKTDQAFARVSLDVTDDVQIYGQGIFARSVTSGNTTVETHRGGNRATRIFADNPYLRPEVAGLLPVGSSFGLQRAFDDIPLMTQRAVTTFYNGQVGAKGGLFGSWKWDANYVWGSSKLQLNSREFESRRYFAAVDAVRDPTTGRIVCGVLVRNPAFAAQAGLSDCAPMNLLGEGNISQAAYNFVRQESISTIRNKMQYFNANVQGNLFDLPAGAVSLAIGAEYRTQRLQQTTNARPDIFVGLAGSPGEAFKASYFGLGDINTAADDAIRGVPANPLPFLVTNIGTADGRQTVKEAYGELLVPLLKDQPFAESLELSLAGRYTDYRTSGAVKTWKAGATWSPISDIRLRGTYSQDIAAPSLFALFAGSSVIATGITDPFQPVGSQNYVALINTVGNPNLNPETARTAVLGVVLSPRAVPGLTFSADAYQIKIAGAIQPTTNDQVLRDCFANSASPVCSQIVRPAGAGSPPATRIDVFALNLANQTTKGIDFELGYRTSLDGLMPSIGGTLNLRAFVNYLDTYDTQSADGAPTIRRAGYVTGNFGRFGRGGLAKWRGTLMQTYEGDRLSIALTERFTGRYKRFLPNEVLDASLEPLRVAPNRTYVDVNVGYDLREGVEAFFNVQNLFDREPPVFQAGAATNLEVPTDKQTYDVVGRSFTVGIRVTL